MSESELSHHGVVGMKWGKRKLTTLRPQPKPHAPEHAETAQIKKKTAKELTDAELKKSIGRMKLEKQYKDLNPKSIYAGEKAVLTVLALGTTVNAVFAFANSPAGKATAKGIQNIIKR